MTVAAGNIWTVGSYGAFRQVADATAGAVGAYAKFITDLYDEVRNSAALLAKYTGSGSASGQVKLGHHQWSESSTEATLLADGPVVYIEPQPYTADPRSPDSNRCHFSADLHVKESVDQSSANTLITAINFVEALRQEIMSESDGTGGSSSWLTRGGNVRISVDGPRFVDGKRNQVTTAISVTVDWPESV